MRIALAWIKEGRTGLKVPRASLSAREPPTNPVFFNPAARLNRDISVAVTAATSGSAFCDALCGIGSRGVRIAKEVDRGMEVTLVDFNKDSLRLAKKNVAENRVIGKCTVVRDEANRFLYSRFRRDKKYDYVDVDPFGTPAPFLQATFVAATDGGIVSLTATDTAVLCGVYPEVAIRRYSAVPLKSDFMHEVGVRILLNSCRRAAAVHDLGIEPVLAHSTKHYLRVYVRVVVGARAADRSIEGEGYIIECRRCKQTQSGPRLVEKCSECGSVVVPAGPLWIGPLLDERVLKRAVSACADDGFGEAEKVLSSLSGIDDFPPYSYNLDKVTSQLKAPGVSEALVSQELAKIGRRSMRQPLEKTGLKTDADYAEVVAAVRSVSRGDSGRPLQPKHA
jgi:tRNA (guanine26-N2/guanine27-N2)-dimethyltransferase